MEGREGVYDIIHYLENYKKIWGNYNAHFRVVYIENVVLRVKF